MPNSAASLLTKSAITRPRIAAAAAYYFRIHVRITRSAARAGGSGQAFR